MSLQRRISWSRALADLREDRAERPEIRWEPLRSLTGLRGEATAVYGKWRGRSGLCGVFEILSPAEAADRIRAAASPLVVLASCPGADGLPEPVRATWFAPGADPANWLDGVRRAGCIEIHIHRLAASEIEAAAFAADLTRTLPATGLAA